MTTQLTLGDLGDLIEQTERPQTILNMPVSLIPQADTDIPDLSSYDKIIVYFSGGKAREIVKSFENLNYAKKWARGRGHTGEDNLGLTSYPPLAYVAVVIGDLVYNPRFSKNIRADVRRLINAQPPNHF